MDKPVERSLLSCRRRIVDACDLPDKLNEGGDTGRRHGTELLEVANSRLDSWLASVEPRVIVDALKQSGGVQVEAARLLGISERSLWHRVKKLEIRVNREVRG